VSTGQPTLVIEAGGRRHRYPAMPEPPSVGGTGPGVWRLTFTIPGWMAPELGRTWLQFGTVVVPLPVAVPAPGEGALGDTVTPPGPSASAPAPTPSPARAAPPPPSTFEPDPDEPEEPPDFEDARRVSELTQRVDALEDELRDARSVRDELAASLQERERTRRIAEQRAHAEQALRRDLARRLSSSAQEAERARQAMGELAAAEERIRTLEHELGNARRRSDEAEQVAAAATAARQRAERDRELAEQRLQRRAGAGSAEAARLRFEQALRGRQAGQALRVPAEPAVMTSPAVPPRLSVVPEVTVTPARPPSLPLVPPRPPAPAVVVPPPPAVVVAAVAPGMSEAPETAPGVVASLRTELEHRARADAALRACLIDAESRLAARVVLERRTSAALAELRSELDLLGDELSREHRLRVEAERRADEFERELREQRIVSLRARERIAELRETLERLATPPEPVPAPVRAAAPALAPVAAAQPAPQPAPAPAPAAGTVEPARLNDALTRLRASVAPQEVPATPSASTALVRSPSTSMHEALARPSLERTFRAMARTDPDAAGRLLLELLPLQRVVYPHRIAYDLVLAPDRCVWVSVLNGTPSIEVQATARPRQEVDFQVLGDPARIARLLTVSGWRRLLRRRVARVRGRKEGVAALSSLLAAPLDLGALHRAGVRPDSLTAFALLAAMIDPAWTQTERFTLAHASPEASRAYLVVREGRAPSATRIAPEGGATITLHCATDSLLAALAGEAVPGVRVDGDVGAYLSLRKWIKRAQSE
jgi:hypothetical protein